MKNFLIIFIDNEKQEMQARDMNELLKMLRCNRSTEFINNIKTIMEL